MENNIYEHILKKCEFIYGKNRAEEIAAQFLARLDSARHKNSERKLTEKDAILITYGDTLKDGHKPTLRVLKQFLDDYVRGVFTAVHILPMCPYSSDDGFSIIDYKAINPRLGSWSDVRTIAMDYHLMIDLVINHISQKSGWFQKYLKGEKPYTDYFIECDPNADYSAVVRPRTLPLLTSFKTSLGERYLWTTFSEDQIDLNFANPDVLLAMLDVLLLYVENNAKYIRLDAVGFLWKELGTPCMHHPKTHEIVKLLRLVLENVAGDIMLITETNVPHEENISYFGNGDEAQLVYQFPLAPLVMYSYLSGNAEKLSAWASGINTLGNDITYFNFLSSHDGIGMRPAEGILSPEEIRLMLDGTLKRGGKVSYKNNSDGTATPYELNINYQDAIAPEIGGDDFRIAAFLGSQTILLSLVGVPGIYIHSLLGSRNDFAGMEKTGQNRSINRETLDYSQICAELEADTPRKRILSEILRRLDIRSQHKAFSPYSEQTILTLDKRVFAVLRTSSVTDEKILAIINVSGEDVKLDTGYCGTDVLTGLKTETNICLKPYECMWIVCL